MSRLEQDQLIDYLEGEEPDDIGLTEDDLPTEEDWRAEQYRQKQEDQS